MNKSVQFDFLLDRHQDGAEDDCKIGSARDHGIGAMNFSRTLPSRWLLAALLFGLLCAASAPVWASTYAPTALTEPPITGTGVSVNDGIGDITAGSRNGLISSRSALKPTDTLRWTHAVTLAH
jgi:hypothetical protein